MTGFQFKTGQVLPLILVRMYRGETKLVEVVSPDMNGNNRIFSTYKGIGNNEQLQVVFYGIDGDTITVTTDLEIDKTDPRKAIVRIPKEVVFRYRFGRMQFKCMGYKDGQATLLIRGMINFED